MYLDLALLVGTIRILTRGSDMSINEKYSFAFEISPVPMLLVAGSGEIVLANTHLTQLFGYNDEELIGQSVEVLVPESARAHHPKLRENYKLAPTDRSMGGNRELTGVTRSGTALPLELGLEQVVDDSGVMTIVVAIDIRQRKKHEDRLHLAMNAAASAMVMADDQGLIAFVNEAAEALFGYQESDLLGKSFEILVPESLLEEAPNDVVDFLDIDELGKKGSVREMFALHRNGRDIPVEISLTTIDAADGKMVLSTILDLTERIAAAEIVAKKSEELEALNVELSHFANSASHDLKAPLSSISGLLSICLEDLADGHIEDVEEHLNTVLDISRRSAEKVEGVLKIARAGKDPIQVELIELEHAINETWVDISSGTISKPELVLDLKHQGQILTELPTLKVILENLLSNAIRYVDAAKPNPFIRVESHSKDGFLQVTVSDNGIGISKENLKKVFDMFKRLDTRSADGLGLTLVQKQLARMGGTINVDGIEGEGAEFTFTLPQGKEA